MQYLQGSKRGRGSAIFESPSDEWLEENQVCSPATGQTDEGDETVSWGCNLPGVGQNSRLPDRARRG
jgi:hypothetical protein